MIVRLPVRSLAYALVVGVLLTGVTAQQLLISGSVAVLTLFFGLAVVVGVVAGIWLRTEETPDFELTHLIPELAVLGVAGFIGSVLLDPSTSENDTAPGLLGLFLLLAIWLVPPVIGFNRARRGQDLAFVRPGLLSLAVVIGMGLGAELNPEGWEEFESDADNSFAVAVGMFFVVGGLAVVGSVLGKIWTEIRQR